jgi:hypothetical protein
MTFLAPLLLALGIGAAVPILLHLLRRRPGRQLDFPALRYLLRAEREHSRRLVVRNLLLMLLRVAAIICIALAAAVPLTRVGGGGHAPTALAIVLDNSLSTSVVVGGKPLLESFKAAALRAADQLTSEDRAWVVLADGSVRGGDKRSVADEIRRVTALEGAGDMVRATNIAAGLARSSPLARHVVAVVTDAQSTGWPEEIPLPGVKVVTLRAPGDAPPNRAVIAAAAEPLRWAPSGAVTGSVQAAESVGYRAVIGGRVLARGMAAPNAAVRVHAAPAERGWVRGALELDADELRGDDTRHFAVWIGDAPAVGSTATAGPFVTEALATLRTAGRVKEGSSVTIGPADEVPRLPAILIAPATGIRFGAANRALERLGIPWRFGALRSGPAIARTREGVLAADSALIVTSRYALEPRVGSADTLSTAGGEPWIVAGPDYVLVASPLDPAATALPIRASFVPWLGEALTQRLSTVVRGIVPVVPGTTVRRPAWADGIEYLDSTTRVLSGGTFISPSKAGVYFLLHGRDRVGALVVNASPNESRLTRLPDSALRGRFRARDAVLFDDDNQWSAALFSSGGERSLVFPLLIVVLMLLLIEMWARRDPARRTAA